MPELISYGGGVNSTAMTIMLVNDGWRGPIVFADTGAEWPETYCYMDYFEREWLAPRGLTITRLGAEWRTEQKMRDFPTLVGYCEHYGMVPLAGVRWCTTKYKAMPVAAWAAHQGIEHQLIGIAADEAHRQKGRICPLVDRGVTRRGCIEIIQAEGLDVPQKSGCYICPFQRASQWRELLVRHPELYARAEALEARATARRLEKYEAGERETMRRVTIDPSGNISLTERRLQPTMDALDMDELLEFRPCVCGL